MGGGREGSALESCVAGNTYAATNGNNKRGLARRRSIPSNNAGSARVCVRVYSTRLRIRGAAAARGGGFFFSPLSVSSAPFPTSGGEGKVGGARVLPSYLLSDRAHRAGEPLFPLLLSPRPSSPLHVVIYVIFERDVSARYANSRFRSLPPRFGRSRCNDRQIPERARSRARTRLVSGAKFFRTGACRYLSAGVSLRTTVPTRISPVSRWNFRASSEYRGSPEFCARPAIERLSEESASAERRSLIASNNFHFYVHYGILPHPEWCSLVRVTVNPTTTALSNPRSAGLLSSPEIGIAWDISGSSWIRTLHALRSSRRTELERVERLAGARTRGVFERNDL